MADNATGEDPMKKWMIGLLTVVFVGLYVAAVIGVDGLNAQVNLIQPIVYVIIGYFFGRMPSEKNEKALRDDAKEKDQKAEFAQGTANQTAATLGAVKRILSGSGSVDGATDREFAPTLGRPTTDPAALQGRVTSALLAIGE